MLDKLKELRMLNAFAKRQSMGMQRKLMFYWVSMILVIFMAVFLFFFFLRWCFCCEEQIPIKKGEHF